MEVTNTYVFTEKDMPGYENKLETGVKAGDPAMPARFLYQNKQQEQKTNGDSPGASDKKSWKGRYQPYVRKAIPKQTALVGTAKHECAVLPVYNEEYRNFQAKRTKQQDAPKFSTQRIDQADVAGNLLAPGTTGVAATSFSTFVVCVSGVFERCLDMLTYAQKPSQPARKTNENKSFRIAKEDLLTMLFDFFAQHEYWTMKGLRQMTNQPEAYLKEVLEELALLHKSGPFTGKWSLRPEYQQASANRAAFGGAAEGGYGGTDAIQIDDDDDDEDEVEMEDVPLGSQPGGPQQK
jgi:transcription initiation factor TFIIF subunit beta